MKFKQISISYLLITVAMIATIFGFIVQEMQWRDRLDTVQARLIKTEQIVDEVAVPRYPHARL